MKSQAFAGLWRNRGARAIQHMVKEVLQADAKEELLSRSLNSGPQCLINPKLLAQEIQVGSRPQVEITILNADNEPITAKDDWPCEVAIQFPSGKSVTQTAWIKKGASSGQFEFVAEEAGLVSLSVRPHWPGSVLTKSRRLSGARRNRRGGTEADRQDRLCVRVANISLPFPAWIELDR